MPPLSFEERGSSGLYTQLATTFDERLDSLATVDYGIHFIGQSTAWRNGDVKNYRTTFYRTGKTPEEPTDEELVVNIIGEVAREGSELSARGNAWLNPGQKIVDKNSVRDVLVLIQPTMATEQLEALYENQIRTIEDMDSKIVLPLPRASKVTHCVRPVDEGTSIVITMPVKFKRSLTAAASGESTTRPEPQLKGLYEPRLLPDYDPSIFSLRRAMLAQQDIRDTDEKLIAPWETQVALHPGTLVSVEATLIVYSFGPASASTVFQIQGRRIKILERSPLPLTQSPLPLEEPLSSVEQAVTTPSTSYGTQSSSKLPPSPSRTDAAVKKPRQAAGPSVEPNPASTSAITTPNQPATSRSLAKRAAGHKNK
ncbi:hypothetical protein BJ322DRAFT_1023056 [Thelephora terrestris]|uniref:Uncharacterized protein n=1 Tax=Thelephora terrestris TaxID=56493 RepID=A0A9P6H926_9AGAM|nr:hypothetical protein BJ322DRAFT_1023056 [Thelephora terrestris]